MNFGGSGGGGGWGGVFSNGGQNGMQGVGQGNWGQLMQNMGGQQGGGWMDMMKTFGGQMQGGQGGQQQTQGQSGTQSNGFGKPDTSVMGKGSNMTTYNKGTRWVSAGKYDFYVPRNNMDAIDASREGFRRNYGYTSWMDK